MPRPRKSASKQAPPPSPRTGHLQQEDYLCIVSWLDTKANFESCFGIGGKTTAGQSQSTKNNGFRLLADELKKRSKGRMSLTPKKMRERFRTYKLNYIKANRFSQSTGAGVTESDIEKGIHTLKDKLEDICPYYEKMDKLFGSMPNVQPLCQ